MKDKIELLNYDSLIFFLIRGCFIGICVNNLFATSRADSWISVILAIVLGFVPLFLIIAIMDKYPDKNIFDILKYNFGKIGNIVSFLLVIFIFILCSFVYWNIINFISSQLLYRTPNIVIGFLLLLVVNCIINKGISVFSRVSLILFYFVIAFYSICFIGLIVQIKPSLLTPIFTESFFKIGQGSLQFLAFNILPLSMLLIIPKNKITQQKNLKSSMFKVYMFASLMLFMVIFILLAIYGINLAKLLQYPEYHLLKRLNILGFIERTENIFSIQWAFDSIIFISFCIYFIGEKIVIKSKYKNSILCLSLLLFTNYFFSSSTSTHNLILKVLPYFCFIFLLGVPLLIFLKKKTTKN